MEENSEVNSVKEVFSTTTEVPDSQQVVGVHANVETVIMVEQVKEEEIVNNDTAMEPSLNESKDMGETLINSKLSPKEDTPKKIDISPNKIDLITNLNQNTSRKAVQMHQQTSSMAEYGQEMSENQQKTPTKTDESQKILENSEEREMSLTNPAQVQLMQSKLEQKQDVLAISGQKKKISENYEEVQIAQTMPNQVQKIHKKSPMKALNMQSENATNSSTGTNPNETNVMTVIKPLEGLEAVLVQKIPTIETSLIKESPKKHEPSVKSAGKPHTAQKNEKLSTKLSSEQLDSKIDSPAKTEQLKESLDKTKGDKKYDKKEEVLFNSSIDICDKSNDSQVETILDISEKEHNNKSISRELKSLIKSAKESKIISECTQLTSKTRKSRAAFDNSNTSLNASAEADKIHSVRRSSITSQKSNCSEKSEKAPTKRSMRSQNPEFVNKVKQFLNSVTGKIQKDTDDEEIDDKKEINTESVSPYPKKKKMMESPQLDPASEQSNKLRSDIYCWRCHWAVEQIASDKGHPPLKCTVCPRSFHYKCLSGNERSKTINEKSWVCPECLVVLHAESSETRSPAMKKISLGLLCELLQYALGRMMDLNGVEPFMHPVDRTAFPDYEKYVVHPMDLSLMKKNISDGLYGSTEAFLADAQWILHNSIIFNTFQSKLTGGARALVRSCRAEMGEIEACPECYSAAHARRPTWFTDVCSTPHMLLWAKLKGFPYWPAKGMSVNSQGLVDVRFFGAHDRAWVHARDCFLYCERDPNNFKAKRQDILESMQEAEQHIRNISRKYGKFVYPPFKTQFDPTKLTEQLKMMIPSFDGEIKSQVKEKSVNTSSNVTEDTNVMKTSKDSVNEGEISETEDTQTVPCRKMADGAEIAREDEDFSIEKEKPMEVSEPAVDNKEKDQTRKRRRSGLEEAVITIITTSSSEKRQKLDTNNKDDKKTESPDGTSGKKEHESKIDKSVKKTEKTNNKVNDKEVPSTLINIDMDIPKSQTEKAPVITYTPKIRPKTSKTSTPKEKSEKSVTPKNKIVKTPQSAETEKKKHDENDKSQKRRKSRSKSLNSSQSGKGDRSSSKRNEKDNLTSISKEKVKEPYSSVGGLETNNVIDVDKAPDKTNKTNDKTIDSSEQTKDHMHFDDDTSLAVIARETAKQIISGLPTISSVRSLSTTPSNTNTNTNPTIAKSSANTKQIEISVAVHPEVNVFTPTSTDNVRTMKEAVDKLQKLKNGKDKPVVGRVGVRAFARMTSPPPEKQKETVEVEVKSEPVDFDDSDRQVEKIDLMRAFHLRPVNPVTTANLRDVRINKVLVAPIARKAVTKTTEVRIRARKTFSQARKDGSDGRSELNGKNSMVYIPIQPPSTQAPIQRQTRPITINGSANTQTVRPQVSAVIANSVVNTVSTALVPIPMTSSLSSPNSRAAITVVTNSANNAVCAPTVGQVPTTVHTVPLITSVNGQWTFSLQPVMSVGGDGAKSPPVVNGLPDRNKTYVPIAPATPHITLANSQILPNNNAENTLGEPPRLQQRPPLLNPLDPNTPSSEVPVPSTAGPLTAKLSQNAIKLADFFRNLLEDSLEKIDEPSSQATFLKLQLEQAQWRHQQQINELKHAHELLTTEMRVSFEKEKSRAISEMRRTAQVELEAAVKAAKTKQWCANCSQEAQFYCCWNTSYCDYSCQRSHWSQHFNVCTQQRNSDNTNENGNSLEKRLQPAPDNLPKNTGTPTLAVGTKISPARVYAQDGLHQKQSIIVSMVDDHSGNQMLKCVGTYKTAGTQQVSPLIINKQILNDENAAKKVVTSGGYLIVGAGNSSPIAPARRTHPVQYTYNT